MQRTEDQMVPEMVRQLKDVPKLLSHNEIQRRTAEQIVDLPSPVFTERISAKRTVEQIIVDFMDEAMSQIMEKFCEHRGVIEAAKTSSRCRNFQRTVEQDIVEVDKTIPVERISGRMGVPIKVIEAAKTSRQECRGSQKYPSGANF